jgi:FkbM family methyltransferase
MTIKRTIQRLVRALGFELRRLENANIEEQIIKDVLKSTGAKIVLDVGANTGQWGDLVLESGFDGLLVSFEAVPSVHRVLAAHAKKRSASWIIAPCAALGSKTGRVEFNISANELSSSALPMLRQHEEAAPQSRYVNKQLVPVERLDAMAPKLLPPTGMLFLKVDTQGYEMEVLKGATGLLDRAVAIQLELSLVSLYEGAPTYLDMITLMESKVLCSMCFRERLSVGRCKRICGPSSCSPRSTWRS